MLGDNIKRIRKLEKTRVNELARKANMSASYISAIERGKKNNPSFETIDKIAKALNVSINELLKPEHNRSEIINGRMFGFNGYRKLNLEEKEEAKAFLEFLHSRNKKLYRG